MFNKSDSHDENMSIQCALDEWNAARTRFNTATEPEMIELAIFQMQSAQKRFVYLVKEKGISQRSILV
ncbi:MAG: DUF2508 family protein [Clostridiales bacterium]|jgi:hypothetical protein|nr:DUF2508 family protein [Clostridiales bacterium]